MPSNQQMNEALATAVSESGKAPTEIVAGITTTRTLERWIKGEVKPDRFKSRAIARRLNRKHEELFG